MADVAGPVFFYRPTFEDPWNRLKVKPRQIRLEPYDHCISLCMENSMENNPWPRLFEAIVQMSKGVALMNCRSDWPFGRYRSGFGSKSKLEPWQPWPTAKYPWRPMKVFCLAQKILGPAHCRHSCICQLNMVTFSRILVGSQVGQNVSRLWLWGTSGRRPGTGSKWLFLASWACFPGFASEIVWF